jgi:ubiquinone/menaquinone biosynthesis C-methylase UbiE
MGTAAPPSRSGGGTPHENVRASYDAVAGEYLAHLGDELAGKPLDRALLAALVDEVAAVGAPSRGGGAIADLGCGPGHVAGWLAEHGARAVGIDLSPAMVETARRTFPSAEFRVGDFLDLPAADGEFAAAIAFYSIIHLERSELRQAFQEMRRVLAPGGAVLVAFHIGDEVVHRREWWGCQVDVEFRFFGVDEVKAEMESAGLAVEAQLERVNYPHEVETRRAYLLGRRGA